MRAAVPDLAIIGQEGSRAIAVHDDEERRACAPLLLQGWGKAGGMPTQTRSPSPSPIHDIESAPASAAAVLALPAKDRGRRD